MAWARCASFSVIVSRKENVWYDNVVFSTILLLRHTVTDRCMSGLSSYFGDVMNQVMFMPFLNTRKWRHSMVSMVYSVWSHVNFWNLFCSLTGQGNHRHPRDVLSVNAAVCEELVHDCCPSVHLPLLQLTIFFYWNMWRSTFALYLCGWKFCTISAFEVQAEEKRRCDQSSGFLSQQCI